MVTHTWLPQEVVVVVLMWPGWRESWLLLYKLNRSMSERMMPSFVQFIKKWVHMRNSGVEVFTADNSCRYKIIQLSLDCCRLYY